MALEAACQQREIGVAHPRLPLPETGSEDRPEAFLDWLGKAIPMVNAMGIRHMRRDGDQLSWSLALDPNLNDKGTGFGGALTAQTTLLGWCWTTLWLRRRGILRDVVVATASQKFLAPVTADYQMICMPAESGAVERLAEQLDQKGRGRIALAQQLWCGDTLCLEASGDYVVLK